MRGLVLLAGILLLGSTAARSDALAALQRPSSTVPGCVNDWKPPGAAAEPTCEGKAARAEWNRHAGAINTARDTLVNASNSPDTAAPITVIDALDICAAAAEAMARLDPPADNDAFAAVLAQLRPWFGHHKLLVPDAIGDGFHTLAAALARPGLQRAERNALYDQAAVFATRESALAALWPEVERRTDAAVRAAHRAALEMARLAATGHPQSDAGDVIRAAAGPDYPAIAAQQAQQLVQFLAAHPDHGGDTAQTRRALGLIPTAVLSIAGVVLVASVVAFPQLTASWPPWPRRRRAAMAAQRRRRPHHSGWHRR